MIKTSNNTNIATSAARIMAMSTGREYQFIKKEELDYEKKYTKLLKPIIEETYLVCSKNAHRASSQDLRPLVEFFTGVLLVSPVFAKLTSALRSLILEGFSIGGGFALSDLGVGGDVSLSSADLVNDVDDRAESQARLIVATTARNSAMRCRSESENGIDAIVAAIILLSSSRSSYRARLISEYEGVWSTRRGYLVTSGMNGVQRIRFMTQDDKFVDNGDNEGPCAIRHGRIYPVWKIPEESRIPIHFGCRCYYVAVLEGWVMPNEIWRG